MSRKIIKICQFCGNDFFGTNKFFCSQLCSNRSRNYKGKNHPQWVGNKISIRPLHARIKKQLKKPNECQGCHLKKPLDLANISNEYKHNLSDWEWLCRKCHMTKDGRLANLQANAFRHPPVFVNCTRCKKFRKHKARGLCKNCHHYMMKREMLDKYPLKGYGWSIAKQIMAGAKPKDILMKNEKIECDIIIQKNLL